MNGRVRGNSSVWGVKGQTKTKCLGSACSLSSPDPTTTTPTDGIDESEKSALGPGFIASINPRPTLRRSCGVWKKPSLAEVVRFTSPSSYGVFANFSGCPEPHGGRLPTDSSANPRIPSRITSVGSRCYPWAFSILQTACLNSPPQSNLPAQGGETCKRLVSLRLKTARPRKGG